LSFAVPYGLALQALEVTRIRTTLLPPEIATARMVRRKKPWAVLTAAGVLVGASLAMVANGASYNRVHTDNFNTAVAKAEEFGGKVKGAAGAYEGEKGTFAGAKKEIEDLVVGRRNMDWMELFNTINDCLPYDDNPAQKPINMRDVISVTHIAAKKEADVSKWFNATTATGMELQRQYMLPADLAAPPSGEGYVVTVHGMHWHHDENDPQQRGRDVLYLQRTLLANLQKPLLELSNGFKRDVGRLGISHATVASFAELEEYALKPGARKQEKGSRVDLATAAQKGAAGTPLTSGFGAAGSEAGQEAAYAGQNNAAYTEGDAGFSGNITNQFTGGTAGPPGTIQVAPGQAPPAGVDLENYDLLHKTTFQIQFVYRPRPKADRDKPIENAAPAEAATSETM
jgi:type IV pilus assembly protein PilM